MKFDCGLSKHDKYLEEYNKKQAEIWLEWTERLEEYNKKQAEMAYLGNWHRYFAWWPVQIASHDCRWLEWIERKDDFIYQDQWGHWYSHSMLGNRFWRYRAIK